MLGHVNFLRVVLIGEAAPEIPVRFKPADNVQRLLDIAPPARGAERAVGGIYLALAVEYQAGVACDPPGDKELLAVGHGFFISYGELAGHGPGVRLGDIYGPADGLVEHRAYDAPVHAHGIALVLGLWGDERGHRAVLQLIEGRLEPHVVHHATDKAVAAVVLFPRYFLLHFRAAPLRAAAASLII